jgi:hypothetical protein
MARRHQSRLSRKRSASATSDIAVEDLARPRDAPGIAVVDERGDQEDGDVDAVTARAIDEGPLGGGVSDERPAHDRRIALLEPPLPYLSQALQPALDDHREGRRRGQRQREPGDRWRQVREDGVCR